MAGGKPCWICKNFLFYWIKVFVRFLISKSRIKNEYILNKFKRNRWTLFFFTFSVSVDCYVTRFIKIGYLNAEKKFPLGITCSKRSLKNNNKNKNTGSLTLKLLSVSNLMTANEHHIQHDFQTWFHHSPQLHNYRFAVDSGKNYKVVISEYMYNTRVCDRTPLKQYIRHFITCINNHQWGKIILKKQYSNNFICYRQKTCKIALLSYFTF